MLRSPVSFTAFRDMHVDYVIDSALGHHSSTQQQQQQQHVFCLHLNPSDFPSLTSLYIRSIRSIFLLPSMSFALRQLQIDALDATIRVSLSRLYLLDVKLLRSADVCLSHFLSLSLFLSVPLETWQALSDEDTARPPPSL